MGAITNGKNAYKPISHFRYFCGIFIISLFHIKCRIMLFLRHVFIKKYQNYKQLTQFHKLYFNDIMKDIKNQKGITLASDEHFAKKHA